VKQTFKVDLEPVGRRIEVEPGLSLLEIAQKAGVDLVAACGGMGSCGTCLVRLVTGKLSSLTLTEEVTLTAEQIAQGYRMACQAGPESDIRLEIPPESLPVAQKMQIDGHETEVELDPNIVVIEANLALPNLEDLRSDLSRANQAIQNKGYAPLHGELNAYIHTSNFLRSSQWNGRIVFQPKPHSSLLITVLPPRTDCLGLAVDMGSTKLALYLINLETGVTIAKTGVMNPQIAYGEDVVSRIAFANRSEENQRLLQTRLVDTLNQVTGELCKSVNAESHQIVDAVIVGNTAMHHFLCGLPVAQLGAAPYVPVISEPLEFHASEVGLQMAPGARVFMPAIIAGFVGADHTSALLATQAYAADRTLVLVDIGTNTEISLIHQGHTYTCSTASGPAFEGAHIRDGMRAAPGAVERVRISNGSLKVITIGNSPAVGICGSGILNAIAEMRKAGILDTRGVLCRTDPRVRIRDGRAEFVLVHATETGHGRDIIITRKDVHEIQLAKGAIRAGIEIALQEAGISADSVEEWVIAGAFGTYLDLPSAVRVGMFPNMPLDRFHQVGNAAGVGAKQMLVSRKKRAEAAQIIDRVNYLELTIYPGFTERFIQAMYLSD